MTQGKAKSTLLGIQGVVGHRNAPSNDFLYTFSTTKDPNFEIGDRVVLPDGRVFRYGLTHGTTTNQTTYEPGRGINFAGNLTDDGISGNVNRAQVIGDKELRYASQSFAEDELRGGYVIIYSAGNTYQQAGIIGNTYCSSSELTIYLDRALTVVVTSTQFTEVLPNPYRYLMSAYSSNNGTRSWAGIPMSFPTAADMYFWIQTWGPCWINPGSGIGATNFEREAVFGGDGSIIPRDATTYVTQQHAGFILEDSAGSDGPPFINLQINP